MTNQQQEQIDKYHSGSMSESEKVSFEKQLDSDPSLKAESELQSDVISGLKEFRKVELKSRLEAINVGPNWFEFIGQSTLMKSMGGVIVASVIGTGIYFYGDQNEIDSNGSKVEINAPVSESIEYIWDLGKEDKESSISALDKPQLQQKAVVVEKSSQSIESENSQDIQEIKVADEEVFTPSFETPTAEDITEESKFEATGLDELPEADKVEVKEDPIDVETENSKANLIKYKYYDGKLFLKGDFDKAPYEILEINTASGRRIYVYYLGTFYKVEMTDQLIELPQVKDQELITELELIRENK